jgi:hypothetical protein
MKKFTLIIVSLIALAVMAIADTGYVVQCEHDYIIIECGYGYTFAEWYGGSTPDVGDKIVGKLNNYGFKDVYNSSKGSKMRIYIDDYWMSESSALEKFYEKIN